MSQTKDKHNSLVLNRSDLRMVWKCHGILRIYCYYYFCLERKGKKEHLDENDFCHSYGSFLESCILKVSGSHVCSKSLLNNYEAH